jgi:hypothetical protein
MKNLISTREALAVAIFAFRKNGKIVKETTKDLVANKLIVWNYFCPLKTELPQARVEVTEELLEAADSVLTVITHSITMSMLTKGRIPNFVQSVHDVIKEDQMNIKNIGILIWAPKLAADLEKTESLKEISAAHELSSKFFGKEGDRIEFNFTLIEKRFVRSIDTWSAYGHNEQGHLVKFLTKHEELCTTGRIRARIRKHEVDSYHNNAKVTALNFVKAA